MLVVVGEEVGEEEAGGALAEALGGGDEAGVVVGGQGDGDAGGPAGQPEGERDADFLLGVFEEVELGGVGAGLVEDFDQGAGLVMVRSVSCTEG
ncbi:hypothetical protein [Streptomyces erythrochromogenes]|uniref:hypothetical protein n=1 Tax=Streptomyces erythrochromogenes TaxID=285574 RepID=UPI00369F3961